MGSASDSSKALLGTPLNGYMKEFKFFNVYMSNDYMLNAKYRSLFNFASENPFILSYWRFNDSFVVGSSSVNITDKSASNLSMTVNTSSKSPASYPRMSINNSLSSNLTFCANRDLYLCQGKTIKIQY